MTKSFIKKTKLNTSPDRLYSWHMAEGAFLRLMPPFEEVELRQADPQIEEGSRATIVVQNGPIKMEWVAEHCDLEEGKGFTDFQVKGPFKSWKHRHRFIEDGEGCILEDRIEYELPLDWPGSPLASIIENKLESMFTYRHNVTANDLNKKSDRKETTPMKILVSGSSGLVGSSLVPYLTTQGHKVVKLKRTPAGSDQAIYWSPQAGELDSKELEGFDAVIHLAGESIASGRWTEEKKRELVDSRIKSTKLLVDCFKQLSKPPSVFVVASAIGFYGDRGEEKLNEKSSSGDGFLADLCRDWETEAQKAEELGIRTVSLRIGVVLTPRGGMLEKVLPPFQMGGGGTIGSGRQYMSWISIDDITAIIGHALTAKDLNGAVNTVSPEPVTNSKFTEVLGKVLSRPTFFPVPEFAAKILFGEMAEETMLASTRVVPDRLSKSGYQFIHPDLESALRHVLGKTKN